MMKWRKQWTATLIAHIIHTLRYKLIVRNRNEFKKRNKKNNMHDWVDRCNETRPNDVWTQFLVPINKIKIHWGQLEFTVFTDILGVTLVGSLDLRTLFCNFCRTTLAWSFCCTFSLMMNKNAIKVILMKRHQNSLKQALLCSAPWIWNSIHMFPFDPCYCSHWNTNPATFPQPYDWICLRARKRHCSLVCMHALAYACSCFFVFFFFFCCYQHSIWFGW